MEIFIYARLGSPVNKPSIDEFRIKAEIDLFTIAMKASPVKSINHGLLFIRSYLRGVNFQAIHKFYLAECNLNEWINQSWK